MYECSNWDHSRIETFKSISANFESVNSNHKKLVPFRSTQIFLTRISIKEMLLSFYTDILKISFLNYWTCLDVNNSMDDAAAILHP